MRKNIFKTIFSSALALTMVMPTVIAARAEEPSWKTGIKDHWNFEGEKPLVSDHNTEGTLHGSHLSVADSGDACFGKVLRFGEGTDNYFGLNNYINTGKGKTSFAMWYRYDTNINDPHKDKSTVLLQHEGNGKSLLTLNAQGKYNTFINGHDAYSTTTVEKGDWEHIAVVFDQDAKTVTYYINGEKEEPKSIGNGASDAVYSLRVGAHKNAGNTDPHPMRGDIDEFYVYDRALTDAEAVALYEDKAAPLTKKDLDAKIAEAEQTLSDSKLPVTDESVAALQGAIDAAKQASSAGKLAGMETALHSLQDALNTFKSELPISLDIDLNQTIREIDTDSIFGINHRYAFNGYGTFDSKTMKVKDDFKRLYQDAAFGSLRYPGGTISNLFNWKTTLGPKEMRKKQIHGFYNNDGQGGIEPNFGIEEVADFADEVNSEIVYVYSLGRGTSKDAADLIEYLNAKVGTNPNGGIDWAKVRADNGHPEPYNVRHFEIGNEMQQNHWDDGRSSQGYWLDYVPGSAVNAYIEGGTASLDKRFTVCEEDWNKKASVSDGKPNLVRYLRYANGNPGMLQGDKIVKDPKHKAVEDGVKVFVGTDGNIAEWKVVDDISKQPFDAKVCTVDYTDGTIHFGDGVHGAIPEKGKNIYASYSVKHEGFLDISKAMKDTTAKINEIEGTNHEALVYTSYQAKGFCDRMTELHKNDLYDGMTVHPYSGTVKGSSKEAFYDDAMKKAEDKSIKEVRDIVNTWFPKGENKVPVISEFGIFRNTEAQLRSQTNALFTAKVALEYAKLGSPYIQKHCLSDWYSSGADSLGPTQQAVIQVVPGENADLKTGEGDFTFFSTPSAHVFKMLNSGFGNTLVNAEFASMPKLQNGVSALSSLVSKDKDGNVYAALVNVDREHDHKISLHLGDMDLSGYKMVIQRLESNDIADENTPNEPRKVQVTEETTDAVNDPVIHLKKHSFATVKLIKEEVSYTQVIEPTENGTVTSSVDGNIKAGTSVTYTFTPADGFHLSTVVVNGKEVTVSENGTYTIDQVNENLVVKAVFAENESKPTAKPTAEPTAKPTAEPTAKPTAEPTAKPTITPTVEPEKDAVIVTYTIAGKPTTVTVDDASKKMKEVLPEVKVDTKHVFKGWSTKPNGEGTKIDLEQPVSKYVKAKERAIKGEVKVHAHIVDAPVVSPVPSDTPQKDAVIVTYTIDDKPTAVTVEDASKKMKEVLPEVKVDTKHVFKGWFTEPNGKGTKIDLEQPVSAYVNTKVRAIKGEVNVHAYIVDAATAKPTDKPSNDTRPATGETRSAMPWAFVLAGALVAGFVIYKRG